MAFRLRARKRVSRPTPRLPSRPRGRLPRRIIRWRRAARALLIYEAVWPVLWPPAGILGAYLCAALLGLPQRLGHAANTLILIADVLVAAVWLGFGLARIRWPDDAAARHRLQITSGLAHDPIAALEDSPAQTDAESLAVWQAHRRRNLAAAARLRLALPWPWRARRDRLAFRFGLIAAIGFCVWAAGPSAENRLASALTFDDSLLLGRAPAPPAVTAWVTPPAYTGRAPLLLPGHDAAASVPAGSRLTVTVSGIGRMPKLLGDADKFRALDASSFQLDGRLDRSGLLTLRGGGERLARWQITVLADQPPSIAFAGSPGRDADGSSLRLPWRAHDDYGVVSAKMTANLVAHPAPPFTLPLALPDGPAASIDTVQTADLTANPWAGLPVTMRLSDKDAIGQRGSSPTVTTILPERSFSDPWARRVIAIRKGLVLSPDPEDRTVRTAAAAAIFETAAGASAAGKTAQSVLPLTATGWQLVNDRAASAVPEVVAQLWQVALHFEQGDAADTAQSLRNASQALQSALQSRSATAADLARLMQAVQAAVLQHLSTLMQMAQRQNGTIGAHAGGQSFDLSKLAQQMRAMEAAARAGDVQAMRQELAALEQSLRTLEQARVVKPDPAQEAARAQAMRDLQNLQGMMREQARLMDRSSSRADSALQDPADESRDASAQAALRRALGRMAGRLGASGEDAGRAMAQAVQQLLAGQDAGAAGAQQHAMTALQKAANALGQQLAGQQGQGGMIEIGGTAPGSGNPPGEGFSAGNGDTDPLGRPLTAGQGTSLGADVALPNGSDHARLRAILQELRDKASDRSLTPAELDYIERLLQPF